MAPPHLKMPTDLSKDILGVSTPMNEQPASISLSANLRIATKDVHQEIESSGFFARLMSKSLPINSYILLLMAQYEVYLHLENALAANSSDEALAATHHPRILARAHAIALDINYFLEQAPGESWESHHLYKHLQQFHSLPLKKYTSRLDDLSAKRPHLLLAHSYVRYMGDINGGQILQSFVQKAYDLDKETEDGRRFFSFVKLNAQHEEKANQAELRKMSQWFREGMDKAGYVLSYEEREELAEEAKEAFRLNTRLLKSLDNVSVDNPPALCPFFAMSAPASTTKSKSYSYTLASRVATFALFAVVLWVARSWISIQV